MKNTVTTKWTKDMGFDALVTGHHLLMDAGIESGGKDQGPRPKPLLLAALSGCSGMDIVAILKKMKVTDYDFEIQVDGDTVDEHPMVYHAIELSFRFVGKDLPEDKVKKAVNLSTEKYCAVNAMLGKTARIKVRIFINDSEVIL